jgi:osmoprotectant transport system permease protein
VNEALAELPRLAAAHLQLSLAGLGLALALSLPLGVAASRRPRLAAAALGGASVIQTIPSLALLAIMVPMLAAIGFLPAWIALTLYAALPILRNTLTASRVSILRCARRHGASA